jgi:hypothetical protein
MSTKLVSVVVGFMIGVLLYRLTDEGMPLKCDITLRLSLPLMSIIRNKYCSKKGADFDSLFALTSWELWKERNARCFRNSTAIVDDVLQIIRTEADRWIEAGAPGLRELQQAQ